MRPFLVLKYNQYFLNFLLTFISWTLVLPSITAVELNYVAFDIVSNDYHIELYGYLQQKVALSLGKSSCSVKECDTASSLKFTRIPKSPLKLTEPLSEVKSQQKEDKDDSECIYLSPNISQISINTSKEQSNHMLYYTLLSSGIGLTSIGALCYYMMKKNINMKGIIEHINLKEIAIGVIKEAQELLSRVNLSNGSIIAILGGIVIIGVISYMLYKTEKENRMIRSLYSAIKEELKTAKKSNDGLTEEEIIRRMSVKNGLTEEKFKLTFLPKLKTLRKKDLSVEEYESEVDGRRILKWQIMDM